MSKTLSRFARPLGRSLALALALGGTLAGCGGGTVSSQAEGFDRVVRPLTGAGGVALTPKVLKGTYGSGCKVNASATWDLKLNDPTDNSLAVALNDTFSGCPLTLTTISVQQGSSMSLTDFAVAPPIVLGNAFAAQPSAVNNGTSLAFYTNARTAGLAGSVYTNNFQINMLYSDDALACGSVAPPAIYAKVTATATGSSVPAPNYSMTFDSLTLVVDANNVVQPSSSGNVVLQPPGNGPVTGEEYKIFDETSKCCGAYSFAEIDAMYKTIAPVPGGSGTIGGTGSVNIPWTSFYLSGKTLKATRFVIVKHTGAAGVYSYELLDVAFPGPNP